MTNGLRFNGKISQRLSTSGFSSSRRRQMTTPREIARSANLSGLSWLPTAQVLSTVPLQGARSCTHRCSTCARSGETARETASSHLVTCPTWSPTCTSSGMVTGSRIRMQSDIWKFPVNGSPAENTRRGVRITQQTGQAQTPSVSPDESEVVYLSDSGGHGNLWIARTDGSGVRQITFERDPAISVGVPVWSPTGNEIVFIVTRPGLTGLSIINRDGSGLRQLVPLGISANWSTDGRWVYYSRATEAGSASRKWRSMEDRRFPCGAAMPTRQLRRLTARRCIS